MITIDTAKDLAEAYGVRQVIIVSWDGDETTVTTYGKSLEDCAQAAIGGNRIKAALSWPQSWNSEPSRVQALLDRIKELESELDGTNR